MDAARSAPKIGKIIKRARERRRMSQAEAAEALGVSRSALNAWENDRAYPRSSVGAIEELYGIVIDDGAHTSRPLTPGSIREAIMSEPGLTAAERRAALAAVEEQLVRERGGAAASPAAREAAPERRRPAS